MCGPVPMAPAGSVGSVDLHDVKARRAGGAGEAGAGGGGAFHSGRGHWPWALRRARTAAYPAAVVLNSASASWPPLSLITAT